LFIGNSQLNWCDVPGLVSAMSQQAPDDHPRIEAGRALIGGVGLKGYWNAGDSTGTPRDLIASHPWDDVVIQEIFCATGPEFEDYALRLHNLIQRRGARTVLLATANVSEFYTPGYTYPDSFLRLHEMQARFAQRVGAALAPAGLAWMNYLGPDPAMEQRLDLYDADKGHPGIRGSTLYAYSLYVVITGRDPQRLPLPAPDAGATITQEQHVRMRQAAWQACRESALGVAFIDDSASSSAARS
jgi:hypothetical protein